MQRLYIASAHGGKFCVLPYRVLDTRQRVNIGLIGHPLCETRNTVRSISEWAVEKLPFVASEA